MLAAGNDDGHLGHTDGEDHVQLSSRHWDRVSSQFHQTGYREGIAAGKDCLVQNGFDMAFAETAAESRSIGRARGLAAALLIASNATADLVHAASRESVTRITRAVVRDLALARPKQLSAKKDSHDIDMSSLATTMNEMRPVALTNALAQLADALSAIGLAHVLWQLESSQDVRVSTEVHATN